MKQRRNKVEDPVEMLYQDAKRERDQRHYYRNLILRSVATFFIGTILAAFFDAFGFGALLVELALCSFVFLFAKTI